MAWKIDLDPAVARELDKLDPQAARRLLKFLFERLSVLDDPRSMGEALKGSRLGEFCKYRVGDYRIIARIEDRILTILVVRMATAARFAAKASIVFYRSGFSRDPRAIHPLSRPSRSSSHPARSSREPGLWRSGHVKVGKILFWTKTPLLSLILLLQNNKSASMQH